MPFATEQLRPCEAARAQDQNAPRKFGHPIWQFDGVGGIFALTSSKLLQERSCVTDFFLSQACRSLFDCHALRQIPRLVHIRTLRDRSVIGEQLYGNGIEDGRHEGIDCGQHD
jgi:hypothetical protein